MKRYWISSLILFLGMAVFSHAGFSQSNIPNYDYTKIIPSSPSYSPLDQYINIPVDYSTGIPNIEIPLFEIKGKKLSIPVSMNYHAGGIRVNQESMDEGLGWSLICIDYVARTVIGFPDDLKKTLGSSTFNGYTLLPGFFYTREKYNSLSDDIFPCTSFNASGGGSSGPPINLAERYMDWSHYPYMCGRSYIINENMLFLVGAADGLLDTKPDIFSFKAGEYKGKFYIVKSQDIGGNYVYKVILLPYQDLKVIPVITNEIITGFRIVLPNGILYCYDEIEKNFISVVNGYIYDYHVGWSISKILSADKRDSILFSYTSRDRFVQTRTFSMKLNNPTVNFSPSGCSPCEESVVSSYFQNLYSDTYTNMTYITKAINTITTDLQTINFEYQSGGFGFKNIYVKNKQNTIIHTAVFDNNLNFTQVGIDNKNNSGGVVWEINNRRKLKGITIDDKKYSFEYYTKDENNNTYDLPSNISPSYDYWGYYNGKNGNSIAIADRKYFIPPTILPLADGSTLSSGGLADRTPSNDIQIARTGTIKKIIYPTGGWTEFFFEQNQFVKSNVLTYSGGIRIRKIKLFDPVNSKTLIKEYIYSDALPLYDKFVYYNWKQAIQTQGTDCIQQLQGINLYDISERPINKISSINGLHILYNTIEEIEKTEEQPTVNLNGKTIYKYRYDNYVSSNISGQQEPYIVDLMPDYWRYGLLSSITKLNAQNQIIYNEASEYLDFNLVSDGTVSYKSTNEFLGQDATCDYYGFNIEWVNTRLCNRLPENYCGLWIQTFFYKLFSGNSLLKKRTITEQGVTTIQTFEYDGLEPLGNNARHLLPTSEILDLSNKSIETVRKYPPDYSNTSNLTPLQIMRNNNMITYVIEKQNWTSSKLTSATYFQYNNFGIGNNIPMLKDIYQLETKNPLTISEFIGLDSYGNLKTGTQYKIQMTQNYDNNCNIISQQKSNDIPISYIWGIKNAYPIVKIEGIAYADINSSLKSLISGKAYTTSSSYANVKVDVDYLKGLLSSLISDPRYMVTIYTYSPFVGMTSQTEPNGKTTYYTYDGYGRLQYTIDMDGNIIQEYKYHYKE